MPVLTAIRDEGGDLGLVALDVQCGTTNGRSDAPVHRPADQLPLCYQSGVEQRGSQQPQVEADVDGDEGHECAPL